MELIKPKLSESGWGTVLPFSCSDWRKSLLNILSVVGCAEILWCEYYESIYKIFPGLATLKIQKLFKLLIINYRIFSIMCLKYVMKFLVRLYIYIFIYFFFFLWRCGPTPAMPSPFFRFLDHIQRRITFGRTPLDEWSARRRDLYLTTHNTHNRQTSMPSVGFEPTISAGERPQTYALDRAATGTGIYIYI